MKWLLITSMLSSPMVYGDEETCKKAMSAIVQSTADTAVCIPRGEDQSEQSFKRFQRMFQSFSEGMKETN